MQKELENLGLTSNESKIYIYLLKKGETTTGSIIKETNIANSRVYESLNSLISKSLVTYTIQKDGKHFKAENPRTLIEIENERKKKIELILPSLINLQNKEQKETSTAVYEGFQGFKTAFHKIIEDCPRNETIYILGFSEQPYKTESLRLFLRNMNVKATQKGLQLKILLDSSVKQTLGKDREKEKYTRVKYMPKGYVSPAAMDIFSSVIISNKSNIFFIFYSKK